MSKREGRGYQDEGVEWAQGYTKTQSRLQTQRDLTQRPLIERPNAQHLLVQRRFRFVRVAFGKLHKRQHALNDRRLDSELVYVDKRLERKVGR